MLESKRTLQLIFLAGLSVTLTACANTRQLEALRSAAVVKAVAEAPTKLPEPPAYCTAEMPTVNPTLNEPVWGPQKRWEIVRSNENDRNGWCWGTFYKGVANHAAGVAPVTK